MVRFITFAGDTPFLHALAQHITHHAWHNEVTPLNPMRVVLPTQRSIGALKRALFDVRSSHAVMLPALYAVKNIQLMDWLPYHHDALQIPPPKRYSEHQRLAWVMHALQQRPEMQHKPLAFRVQSAQSFLALRDECQRVQRTIADIAQVIEQEDYAHHWQRNLALFMDLMHHMDVQAEQYGGIEPIIYAHSVSAQIADYWRSETLEYPVMFAGSTCSTPTTATLLHALTQQAQAEIIFPALDTKMSQEAWQHVSIMHPMATMKHWLDEAAIPPTAVEVIGTPSPREQWIGYAMIPEASAHRLVDVLPDLAVEAAIECVEYANDHEESLGIALCIRQALEEGATSILILCEDDRFIQQITAHLSCYEIPINYSAGMQATAHPAFRFLLLIAELLTCPYQSVSLLALMRHPLFHPDKRYDMNALAAWMDTHMLRGFHVLDSVEAVYAALLQRDRVCDVAILLGDFEAHIRDYRIHAPATLHQAMERVVACARAMSSVSPDSVSMLHEMLHVLEQLCATLEQVSHACADIPLTSPYDVRAFMHHYVGNVRIQQRSSTDAPVHILGVLEARLMTADLVMIPQMNSGVWPSYPAPEPWLNRAMRRRLGMDFAERKMGLAAHDVMMALRAPRVVCSRALRDRASPTQPSPLFERVQMMHSSVRTKLRSTQIQMHRTHHQQHHARDEVCVPQPCPAIGLRMRTFYATTIETLLHQPYAVYVSHILKLRARDAIDAPFSASAFGVMMHDVMQRAAHHYQPHALEHYLNAMQHAVMEEIVQHVKESERPFITRRMQRMIEHVAREERHRAAQIRTIDVEQTISHHWDAPCGTPLTLAARMDRVEWLHDGAMRIVDYKTGTPPSTKDVWTGRRVQLLVAASMMLHQPSPPQSIGFDYWELSGKPSDSTSLVHTMLPLDDDAAAEKLQQRMDEIIQQLEFYALHPEARYVWNDDEDAQSYPLAQHLARVGEW